jgi:hypothetical protein
MEADEMSLTLKVTNENGISKDNLQYGLVFFMDIEVSLPYALTSEYNIVTLDL